MTHFIAVDGEGVTRDTGEHDYVMLSVGDQTLHRDGARLTFADIMPFLYRQHQLNPSAAFVGFYLSYDYAQWLRDISEDAAYFLLDPDGIAHRTGTSRRHSPFPVRYAGWEFDLLDGKRFKLRPAVSTPEPWAQENVRKWMWICDAGPFWQSSFLTAINPTNWTTQAVCTPSEYDVIREGKARRADAGFDTAMQTYNVTENRVLARAMSELDKGFRSQGWKLGKQQWFGPGQVVNAWLRQVQAPTREDMEAVTPGDVIGAARTAYYGGWFEITRHGHVKGDSFEYDINSAYPSVIRDLPCLLHGKWHHGTVDPDGYCLVRVSTTGSDQFMGGLPHRDGDGIISRPRCTTGWYWLHEVLAAQRAGMIDRYTVADAWSYQACDCPPPFRSIETLYEHRLSVGKNTAYGKADKLVYNSAYGKTAQSVGTPRYANAIYAGLITAGCRVMILDAIGSHPDGTASVTMVATDGVYFRTSHPGLDVSPGRLGAWECTTRRNMTLFMPGIYWDDETRESLGSDRVRIKSRGISPHDLAEHVRKLDRAFSRPFKAWPTITVPIRFQVTSPALAWHRGKWDQCGAVSTGESKTLSSDPLNKRVNVPYVLNGVLATLPYEDRGESVPYAKQFGHESVFGGMVDGPDGPVDRELYEYLKGVS